MSAMEPYDITNNEQLRRIEERFSMQDTRIALIEQRVTASEMTVGRLDDTVSRLDVAVKEFAAIAHVVSNTFSWLRRGKLKMAAVLTVIGVPIVSNLLQAIFRHFGWL